MLHTQVQPHHAKMRIPSNQMYAYHGFDDRNDYLRFLADDLDIDFEQVFQLAQMLGEEEDFDCLVSSLEGWRN